MAVRAAEGDETKIAVKAQQSAGAAPSIWNFNGKAADFNSENRFRNGQLAVKLTGAVVKVIVNFLSPLMIDPGVENDLVVRITEVDVQQQIIMRNIKHIDIQRVVR